MHLVNFDIFVHGPHHRHPKVAHNLLLKKMQDYKQTTKDEFPVHPTYRCAAWSLLPFLFRNAGVGMNAGAQSPDAEKLAVVDHFFADVATEVLSQRDLKTCRVPQEVPA